MKRFQSTILCGLASAGLAAACGASSDSAPDTEMSPSSPAESSATSPSSNAPADACPLTLAGTKSSIEDTVDGVVVVFAATKPADLPELRQRVERLADMHNSMHAAKAEDLSAAPPQGPGPQPTGSDAESRDKLDASATVEQKEGGVRLVLRPKDPATLDAARDGLRHQADDLVKNACAQADQKDLH